MLKRGGYKKTKGKARRRRPANRYGRHRATIKRPRCVVDYFCFINNDGKNSSSHNRVHNQQTLTLRRVRSREVCYCYLLLSSTDGARAVSGSNVYSQVTAFASSAYVRYAAPLSITDSQTLNVFRVKAVS